MRISNGALASAIFGAACLAAGCGTSMPPAAAHGAAVASIRAARESGATQDEAAARYLSLAIEGYNHGNDAIRRGDNDGAERYLERASADADLAIALTREAEARQVAMRTRFQIQQLRQGGQL